jgi:hypothetical protein
MADFKKGYFGGIFWGFLLIFDARSFKKVNFR